MERINTMNHSRYLSPATCVLLPSAHGLLSTCLFLVIALYPLLTVSAQSATATLSGTVEDEQRAVVPGANVTVTSTATGLKRQATTNGDGYFTIPLIPPGTYTVRAEHQGF